MGAVGGWFCVDPAVAFAGGLPAVSSAIAGGFFAVFEEPSDCLVAEAEAALASASAGSTGVGSTGAGVLLAAFAFTAEDFVAGLAVGFRGVLPGGFAT